MNIKEVEPLTKVFDIFKGFKAITPQQLIISEDDEKIMKLYYKLYKIKRYSIYIVWKYAVINFSINNLISINEAAEQMVQEMSLKIIGFNQFKKE